MRFMKINNIVKATALAVLSTAIYTTSGIAQTGATQKTTAKTATKEAVQNATNPKPQPTKSEYPKVIAKKTNVKPTPKPKNVPISKPVEKEIVETTPIYNEQQVLNFDISGVRLLMSPSEARAALNRNGYQTYDLMGGTDWKNALSMEVNKNKDNSKLITYDSSKIISAIEATHLNGERIRIEFMPYADNADGVAVVYVGYTPNEAIDEKLLEQKIINKYGTPTNSGKQINSLSWTWYRLLPYESIDKSPYLGWRRYDRTLLLNFKDEYKIRLQKRIEAEIAKQLISKTATHF